MIAFGPFRLGGLGSFAGLVFGCSCARVLVRIRVYVSVLVCVCVSMCVRVSVWVCGCVGICAGVCVCVLGSAGREPLAPNPGNMEKGSSKHLDGRTPPPNWCEWDFVHE